jgi:hypothetical protein
MALLPAPTDEQKIQALQDQGAHPDDAAAIVGGYYECVCNREAYRCPSCRAAVSQ